MYRPKKRYWLVFPIFLVVFIVVVKFGVFTVGQVQVSLEEVNCVTSSEIENLINIKGKNILTLNNQQISSSITSKYLCIKDVSLHYLFPNKINIELKPRYPLVRVTAFRTTKLDLSNPDATPSSSSALIDWSFPDSSRSGQIFTMDTVGFVYDQDNPNLTTLLGIDKDDLKIGDNFGLDTAWKIFSVLQRLPNLNIDRYQMKLSGSYLYIKGNPNIVFDIDRDILKQIASLQLILDKARINEKIMESIDLRFDKPIVVYSPKKKDK